MKAFGCVYVNVNSCGLNIRGGYTPCILKSSILKQTVPHGQLEETNPAYQNYARNVLTKKEKTDKKNNLFKWKM